MCCAAAAVCVGSVREGQTTVQTSQHSAAAIAPYAAGAGVFYGDTGDDDNIKPEVGGDVSGHQAMDSDILTIH